ncbi:putative transcription factor bHLH148 [Cocos nucifera]|uniref:Putative transcription factor bHLH148 n=1 Tax=Cocos nucifera TaxID=13894 RepID=A0A8K0IQI1_COCNU|nr:putative transcription factor bHLH148 [Cocos nucifera]
MARPQEMRRGSLLSVRRRKKRVIGLEQKSPFQYLVRRKVRKLKKMVPGCQDDGVEAVLRKTAEYIAFLELQVTALKSLSYIYGV